MPRDGSGIYSRPPGTDGVPDTSIESTKYNAFVGDVETDLNTPRPIIAGGTGANNATAARDNLDAEVTKQQVTNYDIHTWENGSFYSDAGATGAPEPTGAYAGVCYAHSNAAYITLEARNVFSATNRYLRHKTAGGWSAWYLEDQNLLDIANLKVSKAGDTMTGDLTVPNLISTGNISTSGTVTAVNVSSSGNINTNGITMTGVLTIGVGHTTPGWGNFTTGIAGHPGGTIYANGGATPALFASMNGDGYVVSFQRGGVQVGAINVYAGNTQYLTTSDMRLKEDLQSFDAGKIVDDTKVFSFRWKESGKRSYGVMAQQAVEVYPDATSYNAETDRWFIDHSSYVPIILQELQALRKRVAELEGKLSAGATPA